MPWNNDDTYPIFQNEGINGFHSTDEIRAVKGEEDHWILEERAYFISWYGLPNEDDIDEQSAIRIAKETIATKYPSIMLDHYRIVPFFVIDNDIIREDGIYNAYWRIDFYVSEDNHSGFTVIIDSQTGEVVSISNEMRQAGGKAIIFADEGQFVNILAGRSYSKDGNIANLDVVLQAYDGGRLRISRKTSGSVEIETSALTMTLGLQPNMQEKLARTAELQDRGLSQRFLFFVPKMRTGINVLDRAPYPVQAMIAWEQQIVHLASLYRDQRLVMRLDRESGRRFLDYQQSIEDRLSGELGGRGM